ncbi:ATP-binding protein [Paraburkholderia sp. 31.1]|uniref:AAA family ATPase n=1 Tax=Paraburkholderia sp. 31.1 TaxID=2615205 RepID=UPI0016562ADE|nr:ATP-binding protein [Paraburkholderia sp. 31.1]MBC8723009.1 ATP-binding protein [Paraburkholderia sp. 31.1]
MLVEFRVRNFRSIRDDLCLSMAASTDQEKRDANTVPSGTASAPDLLRSAAIYGPNASGKSALVGAMQYAQSFVATSAALMPGQPLNHFPFKLDTNSASAPSEFEFTFVLDGTRYQYGFAADSAGVTEEWLLVYKTHKSQVWFERAYDATSKVATYKFGASLTGKKKVWQDATRRNALFLSTSAQLNSESLLPVYKWIVQDLLVIGANMQPTPDQSTAWITNDVAKPMLLNFLASADLGISDLSVQTRKQHRFNVEIRNDRPEHAVSESEVQFPVFVHKGPNGQALLQYEEESTGTQRLFSFAAPVVEALQTGRTVVVDELDGSLHTQIVQFLVGLFHHRPPEGRRAAQLIFTTHDTALLDAGIFRRDQIWLMEKGRDQASTLVPLTDFSPRKNEALGRGYLQGRYGALPLTSEFVAGDERLGA